MLCWIPSRVGAKGIIYLTVWAPCVFRSVFTAVSSNIWTNVRYCRQLLLVPYHCWPLGRFLALFERFFRDFRHFFGLWAFLLAGVDSNPCAWGESIDPWPRRRCNWRAARKRLKFPPHVQAAKADDTTRVRKVDLTTF